MTAAVQAAAAGAVIEVAPGRYDRALGERFPIAIDKDLSIEASDGPEGTVIDASGVPEAGVIRFGSNGNAVLENELEGNGTGIGLYLADAKEIRNNRATMITWQGETARGLGIAVDYVGNRIRGAARAGIEIKSGYSEIKGNEITTNGVGIELMETAAAQDHLVQGNDIFSNDFGSINNGHGVARAEENW
ncbi:MAG: DUF1565 domain-containing protein [Candidatus Bipolaricaulia bacterium]